MTSVIGLIKDSGNNPLDGRLTIKVNQNFTDVIYSPNTIITPVESVHIINDGIIDVDLVPTDNTDSYYNFRFEIEKNGKWSTLFNFDTTVPNIDEIELSSLVPSSINKHSVRASEYVIASIISSKQTFIDNITSNQGFVNAVKGDKGEPGIQGIPGVKGDKGDKGDPGIQGIQGMQGIQGLKGDKGDPGIQGIKGDQGIPGVKGDPGIQGIKGDTGEQGLRGLIGLTGTQGIQGVKGDKGDSGELPYDINTSLHYFYDNDLGLNVSSHSFEDGFGANTVSLTPGNYMRRYNGMNCNPENSLARPYQIVIIEVVCTVTSTTTLAGLTVAHHSIDGTDTQIATDILFNKQGGKMAYTPDNTKLLIPAFRRVTFMIFGDTVSEPQGYFRYRRVVL